MSVHRRRGAVDEPSVLWTKPHRRSLAGNILHRTEVSQRTSARHWVLPWCQYFDALHCRRGRIVPARFCMRTRLCNCALKLCNVSAVNALSPQPWDTVKTAKLYVLIVSISDTLLTEHTHTYARMQLGVHLVPPHRLR